MKIHRLALTTDFSPCARQAYMAAAAFAARTGAAIDLVHWVDYPFQYYPAGFQGGDAVFESYRESTLKRLEDETKHPAFSKNRPTPQLLDGYGPDALRKFVDERPVDLIAQASHGYTGFKRWILGSFAERVLRTSSVPVLTFKAREGCEGPESFEPRRILFPHDFSPCSASALAAVRFLAGLYGAKIFVVYVWREVPEISGIHGIGGEAVSLELASVSEELPERLMKDLKAFGSRELQAFEHEEHFLRGSPSQVIVSRAASYGADLICMATHGWTGLKHVVLGSVAEKVVREAGCPTLTVRPPGEVLKGELTGRWPPGHPID